MPIIQSARRINPLDLNKNIKIGVAFPLDEENMFSGTETFIEQVKHNLLNLYSMCHKLPRGYYNKC